MKNIILIICMFFSSMQIFSAEKKYIPFPENRIEVSSFLTEGKTEYSGKCLSPDVEQPWVPAGGNNGKNATITIKDCSAMDIYISIGYVSKSRPDLYEKNSRPKKVLAKFAETGKTKEFMLKDSKEPQQLKLIDSAEEFAAHPRNTIVLSFPEVYEGTKFKDLCVNFIGVNNIFSGITFNHPEEYDVEHYIFGADTVTFDGYIYDMAKLGLKKIEFKYAHDKKTNRLYLLFNGIELEDQIKMMNKEEFIDFINSPNFIKLAQRYYMCQDFTEKQWSDYQKSTEILMLNRFENPFVFQIDYGANYGDLMLIPVMKYEDDRLFSALILNSNLRIRSCNDVIVSDGFYSSSENVPGKNDAEHWYANFALMKMQNNSPDVKGYYSYVTGFLNPLTIKYKVTATASEQLKQKPTYDFIYPDGSLQHGYLDTYAISLHLAPDCTIDSDYMPNDYVGK